MEWMANAPQTQWIHITFWMIHDSKHTQNATAYSTIISMRLLELRPSHERFCLMQCIEAHFSFVRKLRYNRCAHRELDAVIKFRYKYIIKLPSKEREREKWNSPAMPCPFASWRKITCLPFKVHMCDLYHVSYVVQHWFRMDDDLR